MATGAFVLLAVNWKFIRASFKDRAASRAKTARRQIAPDATMTKPGQPADATSWDGIERRKPQDRRKIAHRKMMKKFSWMGHSEIRGELEHRMLADRRKAAPDDTKSHWMSYTEIRDELDRQEAPTIPPWARNKTGKGES